MSVSHGRIIGHSNCGRVEESGDWTSGAALTGAWRGDQAPLHPPPIWFEFYAIAARQRGVRQFLKDYFADYRATLAALIRQGVERGEFHDVDPDQAAIALIAVYEGLTLLWAVDPVGVAIDAASESAVRLILGGLSTR